MIMEIFCWEITEVIHHLKNIKENMKELKKNNVKEKEKKDKNKQPIPCGTRVGLLLRENSRAVKLYPYDLNAHIPQKDSYDTW